MTQLLSLLIGLLVGYYARSVHTYTKITYEVLKDRFDTHKAGVVKPEITRGNTRRPTEIDLTTESGPVMRMSPDEVLTARMKERNEKIRNQS